MRNMSSEEIRKFFKGKYLNRKEGKKMGLFRKRGESKKLEDGTYFAVIKDVRLVNGRYGDRIKVVFQIFNTDIERTAFVDTWVGERNLTRRLIDAVDVQKDLEEITREDLIGKIVNITLQTVSKEGRAIQRVTDIKGVKTK
jgi:hypothetical protein